MKQNKRTVVALIQEGEEGSLRATGAFSRMDIPFKGEARPGDLVEVVIHEEAEALSEIGRPSDVRSVINALALDAGERSFSKELEEAALEAVANAPSFQRKDLRDLPTFTIDGDYTRDFDDAISARFEDPSADSSLIRVWVHIADVTAYLRPGTKLDVEAERRSSSVYLPTMTVPMLPEVLSNGVCSLVPGEDRNAVSVEMLLRDGEVVEKQFYRSLINSDARLTYSHVNQIFLGEREPGPTYKAALVAARQAAVDRTLEKAEHSTEPVFQIEDGEVVVISERTQGESESLIERLMVLANQEVASFLDQRDVPSLYRTHLTEDPVRVQRLLARLRSLGIHPEEETTDAAWGAVERHEEEEGDAEHLRQLLFSSRSPAAYEREMSPHEGLKIHSGYTHFTSPIRRYADVVVHRALLAEIGADAMEVAPRHTQLPQIAEHINERTRSVRKLSRQAEKICRVSHFRYRIKQGEVSREKLQGTVTGMSAGCCFVLVEGLEGMIPGRVLQGEANEEHTVWTRPDGTEIRLGDQIQVSVKRLDPVRGQVSLQLLM